VKGMDNRDLLTAAAYAVIGLVVLIAVLSAGYMLASSLFGGPQPVPKPVPANLTPTPRVVVPSGPLIPIGAPSSTIIPTPVQPIKKSAELVDYGTDKDAYDRGDEAITYIVIKNTGTVPIDEANLRISVSRYVSIVGYVNLQTTSTSLTGLGIQPGETKRAEYRIMIPSSYEGISTAGKFKFTVDVTVWDNEIGSFTEEVEVR
jgi:hypothetical protein